jgi:hypothetical protein
MEPMPPNTPAEFAAIIRAEQPRWAKAIKDSGAKVDERVACLEGERRAFHPHQERIHGQSRHRRSHSTA